jgi:glycosyltransferase involved in cell wall biosynthesis
MRDPTATGREREPDRTQCVVVVGPLPPPVHGAAQITGAMVDLLDQTGWHITTIDTAVPQGTSRIDYHQKRIRAHVRALWNLLTLGRADRRALYIGGAGGNGLWYQVAVAIMGSILGFRIIFHHHSYAYLNQRKLAMRLIARVPLRNGCHIVLCDAMERAFHDLYGSMARVVVISNSSFLELPPRPRSPRRPNRRNGPTLGHLSNLTIEKGLADVIRTLEAFVEADLPASLRLAGPIQTDQARELIAKASVRFGDALEYVGPVPPSEVVNFLCDLDVFLFPSRYRNEAEPLVVIEAIQVGVPVVAFDRGCIAEIIRSSGMTVPPDADFATAVLEWTSSLLPSPRLEENPGRSTESPKYAQRRDSDRSRLTQLLFCNESGAE